MNSSGSVAGCLYRRRRSNNTVRTYNFAKGVMLVFEREPQQRWSVTIARLYTDDDGAVKALDESSGEVFAVAQEVRVAQLLWEKHHYEAVLKAIEEE